MGFNVKKQKKTKENQKKQRNQRRRAQRDVIERQRRRRTGTRVVVSETFANEVISSRIVDRGLVPFVRSRNVEFDARSMKPNTRVYGFFDGVDVTSYCVPKLLEINMTSGTFTVGETVTGVIQGTGLGPNNRN